MRIVQQCDWRDGGGGLRAYQQDSSCGSRVSAAERPIRRGFGATVRTLIRCEVMTSRQGAARCIGQTTRTVSSTARRAFTTPSVSGWCTSTQPSPS